MSIINNQFQNRRINQSRWLKMIEEETKNADTKTLRYMFASGIKGDEYRMVLTEYLARPDRKGHIKKSKIL